MSNIVTHAELVRRITEQVARQIGDEVAQPQAAPGGQKPRASYDAQASVRAEAEGRCQIFTYPTADRDLKHGFIPIGVSARHCHVSPSQVEILFGKGAQLTPMKPLKQPGQFAANETVSIIGPRGRVIERVRILGPARNETQVEISLTDCIYLGVDAPVRASGDHHDTPGILIVGPKGHLAVDRGVIRANRHIHLHTTEAATLGLKDQDRVMVKIDGDKPVIFYDVQIRVSEKFSQEIHIDTDDANAVGLEDGAVAQIIFKAEDITVCGCKH
ncbi:phosphate propanoyltransferase [Candidatus Sumerlaeota bacterium]|nr:phosphate propanoyltransferase [Candidatus Sumerlaeota bacterium]